MPSRLLAALAFVLALRATTADEPAWIYRGRLGDTAIVERVATGEQILVPLGITRAGLKLVGFAAPDAIELEDSGKAMRLALDSRPSAVPGGPAYPHEIPPWWSDREAALEGVVLAVDWHAVPVERAIDELATRLELPVALTPRAMLERARSGAALAIDLRTSEHSASKLLDLVAIVLDLRWWIAADGLWLGPAGERPAPPREVGVRDAVGRAREDVGRRRLAQAALAPQVALDQRLAEVDPQELSRDAPPGELALPKVLALWADRAGARVVCDPRLDLGALDLAALEVASLRAAVEAALSARGYVLATDGNALLVLTVEASRQRESLAAVESEAAKRATAAEKAARETPLGAAGTLDMPRLVAALERALAQPVYADRETWVLARTVRLADCASVGDAFDALLGLEVYPAWVDERLYLVRAE